MSFTSKVEFLGHPGVGRQLAAGDTSANTALTAGIQRISMRNVGGDIGLATGQGTQTATATSPFIADGERLDFAITHGANIAILRAGSTNGVLELTELS